jgi:hypothetical protein
VGTSEVAFENLYLRLRQEGFRTGIDQQLRMQELLDRMQCEPKDLKTVLCPLFATNPTQQAVFYRVFDEVFPELGAAAPAPAQLAATQALQPAGLQTSAAQEDNLVARLRRIRWLLLAGVFVGGGVLYWLARDPAPQPPPPPPPRPTESRVVDPVQPVPVPLAPNDTRTLNLPVPAGVPKVHPEAKRIAFEWSAIFTPLLMFAAFAAYRLLRRRITAQREAKLQEPHFWPLQLEALGSRVFAKQDVRELARRMRQREDAAQSALDVPATISATIQGHGFPRFRYRAIRRPPEYLIAIERLSNVDHFAEMMTDLSRILQADGVLLSRYYFEGDPRRLFTEAGEQIQLEDLAARTQDFRMLLFGSSGCLFHPVSGKLEGWAAPLFERYKLKAILLADAPRSKRVTRLEEIGFAVVPSDTGGLRAAVDFFESGGVPANKAFPVFRPLAEPLSEEWLEQNPEGSVQQLWLAACAVYREINWNLTLRLASAVRPSLLCEAETSRMARMPWMRAGEIPPHWRERLTESIPPSMRAPIQDSLFSLLNTQTPPGDTFAWHDWQHSLRAFRTPPVSRWERFLQKLSAEREVLAPESSLDLTCMRFLDRRPKSRFHLPERLRPFLFEQGLGILGMRTLAWLPAAIAAVLLLAVGFRPWQIHEDDIRNVEGKVKDDAGQLYLLAKVNDTTAGIDGFSVSITGDLLPVTTKRPYWPQRIEMAPDGKVVVVVGKTHPQQGPVKILGVSSKRGADDLVLSVDYAGPVTSAKAKCGSQEVTATGVKPAEELISLPAIPLDPALAYNCEVSVYGNDGGTSSMGITVAAASSTEPKPSGPALNLLAFYKLQTNGADSTGASGAFSLSNTEFRDGALYLNGLYENGGDKRGYRAVASVPRLDYRSLTVALDFKGDASGPAKHAILYGGTSARWLGLNADDGNLQVSLNNGDFQHPYPEGRLTPGRWENVICSVDLQEGVVRAVLDGKVLPPVRLPKDFQLRVATAPYAGTDKEFTFTNYSNGGTFQGYAANLRVYSRAVSDSELQPLFASIAADSPGGRLPARTEAPAVKGKPEIVKFEADRTRVAPGEKVTLYWAVTGGQTLQLSDGKATFDPNAGAPAAETGSFAVYPAATTTYTLGFQEPAFSSIRRSVAVVVEQPSAPGPRSKASETTVSLNVTNATGEPVELFWLDFDGKEKGYGAIPPGANQDVATYVSHIWRFRQNGTLLAEYTVPDTKPGQKLKISVRTTAPSGTYQLGPVGGKGGNEFQFPATSLQSIRMQVGGSIDHISFQAPPGDLEKGFGSLTRSGRDATFDLKPGETITGIGVSSGTLVDKIKFYTNQRESEWFGGTGGGPEQVLRIPPGGRFAGFVGRAGDSLDAIGLMYTGPSKASAK